LCLWLLFTLISTYVLCFVHTTSLDIETREDFIPFEVVDGTTGQGLSERMKSLQLLKSWNQLPSPMISQRDIKECKQIDDLKTQMFCLILMEVTISIYILEISQNLRSHKLTFRALKNQVPHLQINLMSHFHTSVIQNQSINAV
jgi:hypothetical protein